MSDRNTEYGAARFVIGVLSFFGWLLVIAGLIGILLVFVAVSASRDMEYGGVSSILAALVVFAPAAGLVVGGLLMIAQGQLIRSNLDTADDMRETLALLRRRVASPDVLMDRSMP